MDPKVSGAVERLLTIYATYLITKYGAGFGFNGADIAVVLMSGLSTAWGAYSNRTASLVSTAATAVPTATILLDPKDPDSSALAKVTPANVTINGNP